MNHKFMIKKVGEDKPTLQEPIVGKIYAFAEYRNDPKEGPYIYYGELVEFTGENFLDAETDEYKEVNVAYHDFLQEQV